MFNPNKPADTWACHDGAVIYGTGTTERAARDDVKQWVNTEDAARVEAEFKCDPMTPELADRVLAVGGAISYLKRADGVLDVYPTDD